MKNHNVSFAIGVFSVVFYLILTLLVFNSLADLNKAIKISIFQMYKVPLDGK